MHIQTLHSLTPHVRQPNPIVFTSTKFFTTPSLRTDKTEANHCHRHIHNQPSHLSSATESTRKYRTDCLRRTLFWREELVQTSWQTVELGVAGVVTEVPEFACKQHSPVPLRYVSRQCGVQHCGHDECHNNRRAEEDVEDVIELVHTKEC